MTPKYIIFVLIAVLTAVSICDSGTVPMELYLKNVIKTVNTYVDPQTMKTRMCRSPNWKTCNCKPFKLDTPCRIVRWYFEEFEKICRPLCTEDFDHISSNTTVAQISSDIMNLAKTKLECENMCGIPCVVTFPNHTTLKPLGVCMDEIWCDIFPHYSKWEEWLGLSNSHPCPYFGTNCCPENYFRSFPHHPFLHP